VYGGNKRGTIEILMTNVSAVPMNDYR